MCGLSQWTRIIFISQTILSNGSVRCISEGTTSTPTRGIFVDVSPVWKWKHVGPNPAPFQNKAAWRNFPGVIFYRPDWYIDEIPISPDELVYRLDELYVYYPMTTLFVKSLAQIGRKLWER